MPGYPLSVSMYTTCKYQVPGKPLRLCLLIRAPSIPQCQYSVFRGQSFRYWSVRNLAGIKTTSGVRSSVIPVAFCRQKPYLQDACNSSIARALLC